MSSAARVTEFLDASTSPDILVLESRGKDDEYAFARSVVHGLSQQPRQLDCRYLYDARGSELFERICSTPEYYPTRIEAAILERCAHEIAAITGPVRLVELGSGTSVKTVHILDAYLQAEGGARYVPIDVSRTALETAHRSIGEALPEVDIKPIHGTYDHAYEVAAALSPLMMIFLGSSIGNFEEDDAIRFFERVHEALNPGDFFLLGVDLVKDVPTLEAAYNDAAGFTAQFTRNLFERMNRELGSNIDSEAIEHVARYNECEDRIEISARFGRAQEIHVAPLGRTFSLAADERVRVEISRKFRIEVLAPQLADIGLRVRRVFTDDRDWFALLLLERP